MAKTDVLVRMKADTKEYDANIQKARKQLERFGEDNLSAGGVLKQLSGNLIGVAAKFASFGAAASAAMKLAKDAFFNNEQQLDEWGRVVQSSESLYNGFLNSLNTGDISGYLNNINNIVSAAREAYDALDELATYNAFNKANIAGARANMAGAIADYREGKGSKETVNSASQELIKQLEVRQQKEQEAYNKGIANLALQRGVKPADLMKVMTGSYGSFQELKNLQYTGKGKKVVGSGMYAQVVDVAMPANERERLAQAVKSLNDTEIDNIQSLAESAKMTQVEIDNQRKMVARILKGGSGGSTGGNGSGKSGSGKTTKQEIEAVAGSIDYQAKKVQELQKAWRATADDDSRESYRKQIEEAQFVLDKMMGKTSGIPAMNYGVADLAGSGGAAARGNWTLSAETMKRVQKYANRTEEQGNTVSLSKTIGDITGGISSIAGNIEALGLEIPQDLKSLLSGIQAVTSILTTISAIVSAIQVIAGADAVIPFAQGGIARAAGGYRVPGTRYSGDRVPALLNSGELVLNRAQQGVLASSLAGSNTQQLEAVVSAEQIRFVLNNNARRRGASEYITIK
ncbi:MAG: hypothetical protein IIZ97_00170 [Prevotella sp.]|nr:hypothetical protein [Prevotella sp.]